MPCVGPIRRESDRGAKGQADQKGSMVIWRGSIIVTKLQQKFSQWLIAVTWWLKENCSERRPPNPLVPKNFKYSKEISAELCKLHMTLLQDENGLVRGTQEIYREIWKEHNGAPLCDKNSSMLWYKMIHWHYEAIGCCNQFWVIGAYPFGHFPREFPVN